MKPNILLEKSFAFSIEVIQLFKNLQSNKKEFILSKQMMRSATSIGALAREAQNAESTKDFIHKLGIAQKECDETIYWLELLFATEYISEIEFTQLNHSAIELIKIIKRIIITSKSKL